MFQVRARCGHCSQKNPLRFRKVISFHPLLDRPDPNQPRPRKVSGERYIVQQHQDNITGDAAALAVCGNCGRPSLVIFKSRFKHFKSLAENLENDHPLLGGKAKRLVDRIDELLEKNVITRPLADWAHALRLDGNQAAHDLHGTRAEAEQYVAFLRMFMELTFSLPERIKRVQDENPPQGA